MQLDNSHAHTLETFMCLSGQFEIRWGDDGQFSTLLDEQDMISVPPNVMRAFRNSGKTPEAVLLVMIQGEAQHMAADIQYAPAVGDRIEKEFGTEVRQKIENVGWRFDAVLGSKVPEAA